MLDMKFVRENPELIKAGATKKHIGGIDEIVDRLLDLDVRVRELKHSAETKKAEQNKASKRISNLEGEEKQEAIGDMKALAAEQKELDREARDAEAELTTQLLHLPNPPADEVPEGKDDTENTELHAHGEIPEFGFEARDHVDLCAMHDMLDVERATRIAGSRTYFLRNAGALLELSILRLALDHMVGKGYSPMLVPNIVRYDAMVGTAYFPGGEEQAYGVSRPRRAVVADVDDAEDPDAIDEEMYLIGTAEVPLTAYRGDEIMDAAEMPLRMCGWSNCFRREAGAAGKDTRGLYRIHQFQKVEQVIICENDEEKSREYHQEILKNSEEMLQMLELPYRVVNVCGGDLGRGQIQKYDIETWMPSREGYCETHSASRFHEFQSRRLGLRYRGDDGKVRYCHTLNNTVIASPRVLIPLLECHQREDGSIGIPEALRPYMGCEVLSLA